MDQLARDFADEAHHLFIYTRETHPELARELGLPYQAFTSGEEKFERAKLLKRKHNSPRTILVDFLDGDVHRKYAGVPNQSWVIDHTGRIAFKASWTHARDLRPALEGVLEMREVKREGARLIQYYREVISYRES